MTPPRRRPTLGPGAVLGVFAPSGPLREPASLDRAARALAERGYTVRPARRALDRNGYLAGTEEGKAADFADLVADPGIDAVVCLRGGYGALRLLVHAGPGLLSGLDKPLIGFSDVTALHACADRYGGVVTYHGPNVTSLLDDVTSGAFRVWERVCGGGAVPEGISALCPGGPRETLVPGTASGPLVGGNVTTLASLAGTPFTPSYAGKIVFLEEVSEAPYRLDRCLTQLLIATDLGEAAGFAVGTDSKCDDPHSVPGGEYRQTSRDVWYERLGGLGRPLVAGLPFGHVTANATLPVGADAVVDGGSADLYLP